MRAQGVTLPELLIVVAIIAAVGTFALPSLNSLESLRVETATAQLRAALRFARDESIRTGSIHSVEFNSTSHLAQVLQITDFGTLNIVRPVVRHPVSRQLYQLDLDDDPTTSPTQLMSLILDFDSVGPQNRVDFTATGEPVWIDITDEPHRLLNGSITLRAQASDRTITLNGFTGRITRS